jgi:hypothetical protein
MHFGEVGEKRGIKPDGAKEQLEIGLSDFLRFAFFRWDKWYALARYLLLL